MPDYALKRLLCVLEVGLPLLPGPVESRQTFKLRSLVREDFLCKEVAGFNSNKPCV